MAINFSSLRKPDNPQVVDPSNGRMREEWQLYFDGLTKRLNGAVGELGVTNAPADAEFIVSSANGTLSAERVATDTTTVDYDAGTAGQAKWNVREVPGIGATGLVARTAAATYAARTLAGPAAGISVSNGDGVSGNPTLALANDLAALEGLGSTGFAVRTDSDAWAQRSITGGTNISVTNGDGVSGNPSIDFTGSILPTLGFRNIANISGGDTIIASDQAKLVNIATGTGTLAFTAVSTLAANFWCIIKNSGTGNVTLNPDGAEQIDGLASWVLYPGGAIAVQCDGSALRSVLLSPMTVTFNSSGTFTTPGVGTWVEGEIWGAGASGGRGTTSLAGGGGGGGACVPFRFLRSSLSATETVTIGAGGAARTTNVAGATGGNTTFGTLVTGYGGEGGSVVINGRGGQGGGALASGPAGGDPSATDGLAEDGFGGAWAPNTAGASGANSGYGGGGGGCGDAATGGDGGNAFFGGGGGGGGGDTTAGGSGGVSLFGGSGGAGSTGAANATDGSQPGGGGGGSETGNSGAGGNGRLVVRVY